MTAHRSNHPDAALARERRPDPAAEPERCFSAAAGGEASAGSGGLAKRVDAAEVKRRRRGGLTRRKPDG
nr:unnamed protein product [Digitaria exilis]